MIKDRKELIKLLTEFTNICKEKNLWYSMDDNSLLGVVRHTGFVPWIEKVKVMMSIDSYAKLAKIFMDRVVDSSIDPSLKNNLKGYFVNDKNDILIPQPFIEIRILVPTIHNKIKTFRRHCLIKRIKHGRMNTKSAINALNDKLFEGYMALESKRQVLNNSWIQVLSWETVVKDFAGIKVNVIKEYDVILKEWFGEEFMIGIIPRQLYKYSSPKITIKEEV